MILMIGVYSCGSSSGGGSGSSADLSCAPAEPSTPDGDLTGTKTLTITVTSSTCSHPPTSIVCIVPMVQTGTDVAISGTCTSYGSSAGTVTGLTLGTSAGVVSGSTLYWGGTLSYSEEGYSETDVIPCTDVVFTTEDESEVFTGVTVGVTYVLDGEAGTCTSTVSGQFLK